MAFSIYVRYCGTACVYFSFRWGPFVHSLGIVQWNSTRQDHPGNPGRVSGSGLVNEAVIAGLNLAHSMEVDQLEVCSDSQLVVRQIEDTYEAKGEKMILYLKKVR